MATDPTPFLSTMTGSTAALVAIIGGLLVSRFIGLDSDQQGAAKLLQDAEGRLKDARDQARDAADELVAAEVRGYLDNEDVVVAILGGVDDIDRLRQMGGPTHLTADDLRARVAELRDECHRARTNIQPLVPENPSDDMRCLDWHKLKLLLPAEVEIRVERVWWVTLHALVKERFDQLTREWRRREEDFRRSLEQDAGGQQVFLPNMASPIPAYATAMSESAKNAQELRAAQAQGQGARHIERLREAVTRADQKVDDLEADVARSRGHHLAIIKPNRQLWIGLIVLLLPSVVGIVLPVLAMSQAPTTFTPYIHHLVWWFLIGLAVLIGYLAYLVARLTHRTPQSG